MACAMSDLRVSQDVALNLFFLADSLPASANCSRADDQGSPRSFGSRPSAINWPNLVILKSSLRCRFKLISFN